MATWRREWDSNPRYKTDLLEANTGIYSTRGDLVAILDNKKPLN